MIRVRFDLAIEADTDAEFDAVRTIVNSTPAQAGIEHRTDDAGLRRIALQGLLQLPAVYPPEDAPA